MIAMSPPVTERRASTRPRENVLSCPSTSARRRARFSLVCTVTFDGSSAARTWRTASDTGATRSGRVAVMTISTTGSDPSGCGSGTTFKGSSGARKSGTSIPPTTASSRPDVSEMVPDPWTRPSKWSDSSDAYATCPGSGRTAGTPMASNCVPYAVRTGTGIPSGTTELVASTAAENAPIHSMPPTFAARSSTSEVTPEDSSARIVIDRVPAESMDCSISCSAATVRPVVRVTARIEPATMRIVSKDATGCARPAQIASWRTSTAFNLLSLQTDLSVT